MKNLRSEFEKFPEIVKNIDKYVFCDLKNEYKAIDIRYAVGCIKINGAWYAFQEQQKKIDEIDRHFQSLISESELWGFSSDQATRQIELIQELLK